MHRLAALFHRVVGAIQPAAEHLGGPGLALVAFLDSSFLSLPEVADALLVVLTVAHRSEWLYFAAMTTLGSVGGCYALYAVGRKGGDAFLRRRFKARSIERGLALFRRHGLLTVIVPSLLPPPMPFKIFVLLAGVAGMKTRTFLTGIVIGRGFRYGIEAWLAYEYGERATQYIRDNLPALSLWAAGVLVAGAVLGIVWRRRNPARAADA
jgi:membrane protein YqaA with SNARE-associated domain